MLGTMLGTLPSLKKNLGAPLQSRKAMLETLFRHLDMVRLSVGAILMVALVGCTGLIDGGSDGMSDQQRTARARWTNDAYPALSANCAVCHNGSRVNIGFLVGDDQDAVKTTLLAYQPSVVNFEAPGSSRILSKGLHDGPELTASQSSAILQWLQAERDAAQHDPLNPVVTLKVPAFAVQICTAGLPDNAEGTCPTNHVSLATVPDAGALVPGAEISFTAQKLTSLYVTNLKLNGGTAGAYIEHPLFVSIPAMGNPFPDQLDRFFNLKDDAAAAKADLLAGGTHSFAGFNPDDMLEIHFKVVAAYKPDTSPPPDTGGCKVPASFKTNAAGPLQTNCASCHTGAANPGAKAALDITGVNSADPAMQLIACNQVRSRINLVTTAQSGFYLAPDPASATNHPFKFAAGQFATNFQTPVDIWVQAEKKAP
jgi:mono/diheme cytochrome c family protein